MAQRWEKRSPKAAVQILAQFEAALAVHALPREQRRRGCTTNLLERLMREIKRRIRVVGIFLNAPSCDRLIGAPLIKIYASWQCERARCITSEQAARPVAAPMSRQKAAQAYITSTTPSPRGGGEL